jgi:hypothetical protein
VRVGAQRRAAHAHGAVCARQSQHIMLTPNVALLLLLQGTACCYSAR